MNAIIVNELKKQFKTPIQRTGSLLKRIPQYFFPSYQTVNAVNGIDFTVKAGERVAFIGPNGAGKSTTIKILTGIMQPTEGIVQVFNKNPSKDRKKLTYEIGAVFGQRSQLWFHLAVEETFRLLAAIYDIPTHDYKKRLSHLIHKFEIQHLLYKPVRQLSLGERMRCEIVASFLHNPKVLFLDEPTIGLDITAKAIIRDLIKEQSVNEGATLLLTSHDTDDIEKVCDRVIIIDHGKILLDDRLNHLKTRYILKKAVTIAAEEENIECALLGISVLENLPHHLKIEIDLKMNSVEKVVSYFLEKYTVKDLTIEGPPLEHIIQMLYTNGVT